MLLVVYVTVANCSMPTALFNYDISVVETIMTICYKPFLAFVINPTGLLCSLKSLPENILPPLQFY